MNVTAVERDALFELVQRAPALEALAEGPLDRADLEERLDVSRATSHRITRSLADRGLIERVDGAFRLTALGEATRAAVDRFGTEVTVALRLAPVIEAVSDVAPLPLSAFADAKETRADRGDPHAPVVRFLDLVRETGTLRGFDTWSIAPTYMEDVQERILAGMRTELVDPLDVVVDVMESYPEKCVEVCVSGNLDIWLHDALPFGLAIFDDRIGVAVADPGSGALRSFVDTDDPAARDWAETTFEAFRGEAVYLEEFTKRGLRQAGAEETAVEGP